MLRKSFNYLVLFFCISLCTSCFEILEEVTLKPDGSGAVMITFNMSKSKSKIASLMLLDSVNGYKIPSEDDIDETLKDVQLHLEKTPGISNIKKTKDYKNYIFSISCDFKNVDNINTIFKEIIVKQNKKEGTNFSTTNFSYDKTSSTFKRHFKYDQVVKKTFYNLKPEDKKVFNDASYTCIYRFANKVKNISNKNAKVSPNQTAVMLRTQVLDLILGEKNLENNIELIK